MTQLTSPRTEEANNSIKLSPDSTSKSKSPTKRKEDESFRVSISNQRKDKNPRVSLLAPSQRESISIEDEYFFTNRDRKPRKSVILDRMQRVSVISNLQNNRNQSCDNPLDSTFQTANYKNHVQNCALDYTIKVLNNKITLPLININKSPDTEIKQTIIEFPKRESSITQRSPHIRGSSYRENTSKLHNIIRNCQTEIKNAKKSIVDIDSRIEKMSTKADDFSNVVKILNEIETKDGNLLEILFNYKLRDLQEFKEETWLVTRDFKSGQLDPAKK